MSESCSTLYSNFNRRRFLKFFGLTAGLMVVTPFVSALELLSISGNNPEKRYRGTADGRIFLSVDHGRTWNQIADFGKGSTIEKIVSDGQGTVLARLKIGKGDFWLQTRNDETWVTDGYIAPGNI